MDRKIVYPGQIPLETDLLLTNKFAMEGLARLSEVLLGSRTCLYGLECSIDVVAPFTIHVSEGQIYQLDKADRTRFSSIDADSRDIVKQGYIQTKSFPVPRPEIPGHSICYLVQVAYEDKDTDGIVLPYYNASNPAAGFSGPENSGKEQHTVRAGRGVVGLKSGVSAPSGSEQIQDADSGHCPAWVITVKSDAVAVTAKDIVMHPAAPIIPREGLMAAVQQGGLNTATDNGSQNNYRVSYHPPVISLNDGLRLYFRTKSTNTGHCTLEVKGHAVKNILTTLGEQLGEGIINTNRLVAVEWCAALDSWILRDPADGYSKAQADQTFLPLKGGAISGDVTVNGVLGLAHALKIGEAELSLEGDIAGGKWEGSLYQWLSNKQSKSGIKKGKWWWKDPKSKILIQGGQLKKADNNCVEFPVAFAKDCLSVLITQSGKSGMSRNNTLVTEVDNYRFHIDAGRGETSFYWVAFGFN
ncbi:hypothetical protein IBT49_26775 [Erwinia sp. S63]|uniref:gp53-like domain-containing protein n=1 Tax=Erwinia sp. S63 TaxID=2769341 RepID=UPI00190A47BD|nr:hypothetical protein [Erwinia sp. S63]MBK0099600.1 hypothetical protein [Erwinia sp. S63]